MKDLDYLTYTETFNEFKLSDEWWQKKVKSFLKIAPRPLFLVGKLCLGGFSKFNCILLLRNCEFNRYLYIENGALTVFSGFIKSLDFCKFSLVEYLS